jgi:hypothetical protein
MNSPVTGFIFSVLFPHQGWWYEDFRKSDCRSKKATAGHLVTYHTDSLYYLASRCRVFGCLDAGCVLLAVYEFSELPRSTRWWDEHNVMHSLTNFTSRTPVAAMAIPWGYLVPECHSVSVDWNPAPAGTSVFLVVLLPDFHQATVLNIPQIDKVIMGL